jgi:CGNR zinc finger
MRREQARKFVNTLTPGQARGRPYTPPAGPASPSRRRPPGTRRFCSTACQNRVKAAVFRERQGGGQRGIRPAETGQDQSI